MKLVLHNYWRSSASHRVRIALGLKKLDYEYRAVNIVKDEHFGDAYKAHNPMSQVPTLEIIEDGASWFITQSLAIMEYLDERWSTPFILPGLDPFMTVGAGQDRKIAFARARARAMAEIVNAGIQPLQNLTTTKAIKKLGGNADEWPKPFIANGLAAYEALVVDTWKALGHSNVLFSAGDIPTIADCCLVPQLASARRFGVDYSQHATLVAIEKRCLELPAFAKAAPEHQPDAVKS